MWKTLKIVHNYSVRMDMLTIKISKAISLQRQAKN